MKATDNRLLDLISLQKQYVIPVYQRNYSWNEQHCKKLWNDVVKIANYPNFPSHFIGSIVYIRGNEEIPAGEVEELYVIDGQQRLITISLLLAALAKAMKDSDRKTSQQIKEYYLFHMLQDGDKKYRLKPTHGDKEAYFSLLDECRKMPSSSNIMDNFLYFENQLNEKDQDFLKKIYQGIGKLKIVEVILKRGEDDPQLIFESLNSTGLELSKADLIRNFILMGLEEETQEILYKTWSQMEMNFAESEQIWRFDRFFRDYLTIKRNGVIPTFREIYPVFRDYYIDRSMNEDITSIVNDIYKYSDYYISISSSSDRDTLIRNILNDINDLRVDVAYTFLMEVYEDREQGLIGKEEFTEILTLIESYVFRRAICGIPTQALNKIFAALSKELVRDKEHYLESFKAALLLKDSYRRFPGDDEFIRELMVKDLYHFHRDYWLRKLENYGNEIIINVKELTCEHIMPQNPNLSEDWQRELGNNWKEIHNRYKHTIGNLTLLPKEFQPKYSDLPFLEKRDKKDKDGKKIGYKWSKLSLTDGLGDLEHWNEDEIKKRATNLANLAAKVWPYPQLSSEILAKYSEKKGPAVDIESALEDSSEDNGVE